MKHHRYLAVGLLLAGAQLACATEVQTIRLDEADIYIVRRTDIWTPNEYEAEFARLPVANRNFSFYFFTNENQPRLGTNTVNGSVPDNSIAKAIAPEFEKRRVTQRGTNNWEYLNKSILIKPENFKAFIQAQQQLFRQMVIQAGDPEKLEAKVARQSFFSDVLGLVAAVALTSTFGVNAGVGAGSSLMQDMSGLPKLLMATALPLAMPGIDLENLPEYKAVEFKRIGPTPKQWANGQILIAYKTERTPELAERMFIQSIPTALGVDTTPEAVDQARKADFESRKAIWAECVAAGDERCK